MFCAKCGSQLSPDAKFCPTCGAPQQVAEAYSPQYGAPVRQITRPRQGRVVAGVCAGLAQYLGWDVVLIRVILLVLVLGAGTGVLAYVIGWIAIPEEPYALPPGATIPPPTI